MNNFKMFRPYVSAPKLCALRAREKGQNVYMVWIFLTVIDNFQ